MAIKIEGIRREIRPGDIVIPLSEVMEKLESQLTTAELNAFLQAILAGRRAEVRPGELITADLMNQVLAQIASLDLRVTNLETNVGEGSGKLTIIGVTPNPVDMGSLLTIIGSNFGTDPKLNVITIGGAHVQSQNIAGGPGYLAFKVRPIQGVPSGATGKQVTLTVSNPNTGFASTKVTVRQAQPTIPSGTMRVHMTKPPNVPQTDAGSVYVYEFTVNVITNMDETYLLEPMISELGWSARIVDAGDTPIVPEEIMIPKGDPPNGRDVKVNVEVAIPGDAANELVAGLRLRVTAKHNEYLTNMSTQVPIVVNGDTTPEYPIKVSFLGTDGHVEPDGAVRVPTDGSEEAIDFEAIFPEAGRYQVLDPRMEDDLENYWNSRLRSSATIDVTSAGQRVSPVTISISAQAGAPETNVLLEIQKKGDSTVNGIGEKVVRI